MATGARLRDQSGITEEQVGDEGQGEGLGMQREMGTASRERGAEGNSEPQTGKGLVVVTGVFDLLHVGHLRFLEAARALGVRLVVGVEGDERVRQWKGPNRPIQTEEDRCELLGALRVVDDVFVIHGERTDPDFYNELLAPLRARYLAVTADDPLLEVKRTAVERIGMELRVVIPRIENRSTTHLVDLLGLG